MLNRRLSVRLNLHVIVHAKDRLALSYDLIDFIVSLNDVCLLPSSLPQQFLFRFFLFVSLGRGCIFSTVCL